MNSLARTLANEEPNLTTIAVRPGVVDTQMQSYLRQHGLSQSHSVSRPSRVSLKLFHIPGPKEMKPEELDRFLSLHASQQLLSPSAPAKVIAELSIKIPKHLSGEFLSWDSTQLSEPDEA